MVAMSEALNWSKMLRLARSTRVGVAPPVQDARPPTAPSIYTFITKYEENDLPKEYAERIPRGERSRE